MKQGVVKFRFVDNASDKPSPLYDFGSGNKRYGKSPAELQRLFLANLHAAGFEPFDGDDDGFQYWKRKEVAPPAGRATI